MYHNHNVCVCIILYQLETQNNSVIIIKHLIWNLICFLEHFTLPPLSPGMNASISLKFKLQRTLRRKNENVSFIPVQHQHTKICILFLDMVPLLYIFVFFSGVIPSVNSKNAHIHSGIPTFELHSKQYVGMYRVIIMMLSFPKEFPSLLSSLLFFLLQFLYFFAPAHFFL